MSTEGYKSPKVPNYSELVSPPVYFPDIGKLRDRVKICCWTDKPEGLREIAADRPGVFTCWAFIDALGPIELEGSRVAHAGDRIEVSHTIVIREPSDSFVDRNFWVFRPTKFGCQWYRIRRVENLSERNRMLWLLCNLVENYDRRQDPVIQSTEESTAKVKKPAVTFDRGIF